MKITITITTPKLPGPRGLWKWSPLLIGAGIIVALMVLFPPHGPDKAAGLHAMPCADLDGDTDVDFDDVNIVVSYFFQFVPTAPAQVDNIVDGQIKVSDINYVVNRFGTTKSCQDAPVACKGGPCATKTPTALPPTPTQTPTPPWQINITNLAEYVLPKTCFQVRSSSQVSLFTVCDNDFQGPAESDAVCVPDGVCNDEDPAQGSVKVSIAAGDYRVVESKAAPNHTAVTGKQVCDATTAKCAVTFVNRPNTRPWFPWDHNNDGTVLSGDITDVVNHYGLEKPLP